MAFTRQLYLRLLGLCGLLAVGPFWWQLPGLIGSQGISPAAQALGEARPSAALLWQVPTLAWVSTGDAMLHGLCALAFAACAGLLLGAAPRLCLALAWGAWVSLLNVGGVFLSFQWDVLLAEAFLFSIPFAPAGLRPDWKAEPSPWARLVLIVIAFKVTFSSGVVKLASADPSWRDLTALTYHWWTQPLPTWTSALANAWALPVQRALCLGMFVCELLLPPLAFGPRPARLAAGGAMLLLQAGLAAAGNYSYFNVLSAVLCLPLLDDAVLRRPQGPAAAQPRSRWRWAHAALLAFVAWAAVAGFLGGRLGLAVPGLSLLRALQGFHSVNAYGAFAVMTKTRPEVLLEGSDDGVTWKAYALPFKPGRLEQRPRWASPWQPRLDWQLWFAALGDCGDSPWFAGLLHQLLRGSGPVRALLETDPFPQAPPRLLRSTRWQYRFAPLSAPGLWWERSAPEPFCPDVTLGPTGQLQRAAKVP